MGKRYNGLVCLTDEVQEDSTRYDQFVVGLGNELSNTVIAATTRNDGEFSREAAVDVLLHALAATIAGTNGTETHAEWDKFMEQVKDCAVNALEDAKAYGHLTIDFDQENIVYDAEIGWTVTGDLLNNPASN